jgi:surface protein
VATLASTDRLVITYALSGTATVEASVQVSDVFKYSDTWVDFKLTCGQVCGKVVVKDGAAVYTNTDGIDYTVCAANASCSAFTVNEEAEVEALVAAAQLALGDSTSTGGRRRLDDNDDDCTTPYRFQDSTELKEAVASYLADQTSATETFGDISTWNTRQVTDMSSLFEGKSDFNGDISQWDTSSVTSMKVRAIA